MNVAQGAAQVKKIKRVQADGNEIEQADDDGEAMDNDEAQSINWLDYTESPFNVIRRENICYNNNYY